MNLNKKNILLTGGSGFIGKNIIELLYYKYNIMAPSHSELDLMDSVQVNEYLKKNKIDVVIHAATTGVARDSPDINNSLKSNLKIFFNIVNNKHLVKKIIFLGSGAEYDNSKDIVGVGEIEFGKYIPSDDYGFYKYICSKYIENSSNIINLRIFGLFGKYEKYCSRFISNIICRDLCNLPIKINQNRIMSYMYIVDFCKIIEYFIDNDPKKKFYNIGGENYELIYLAKKIKKISKKDFEIIINKKGFGKEYTCNNESLCKELNFLKFTNINIALKEIYSWYILNKSKIKKEELLKH